MADVSRALAAALEPVVTQVYFSPECADAYSALGFEANHAAYPANGAEGKPDPAQLVRATNRPAYWTSRGSVMGQVPGEVVAAAFAVFNPEAVTAGVELGWSLTDAATICAARDSGAIAQLVRILGEKPERLDEARELLVRATAPLRQEGKPLYAGLLSLGLPGHPLGDIWRLGDMLREYRGDAHTASWTVAGFDGTEIGVVTEHYWGVQPRTYVRSRFWSDAQLDAAEERLTSRGLLAGGRLTERGRAEREAVEEATDRQCSPIIDALGDDIGTLIEILEPWGAQIREAGGYPPIDVKNLLKAGAR